MSRMPKTPTGNGTVITTAVARQAFSHEPPNLQACRIYLRRPLTVNLFPQEVKPEETDTDSAYILFYEQQGVDYSQFMPKTDGKKMADTSSMDEDFETDYKKYCVLQ